MKFVILFLTGCLLGCGHKKNRELCPTDTHLISHPEPGHGPNPFDAK